MITDPPPVVQHDGVVVVQGDALGLLYRAIHALAIWHHHDGIAPPPLLHHLRAALYRAATSPQRHEVASAVATSACSNRQGGNDLVSTGEAAALLTRSRRQVQRLAADPRGGLGAIRVGNTWLLSRSAVLARAMERDRDRRTDGVSRPLATATGSVDAAG